MKTSTKIILGLTGGLAIAVLALVAVLVGGFYYIDYQTVRSMEATEKVRAAGTEYGKTTDNAGCIEKTFVLEPPFTGFDYSRMFARECLRSSRPTPHFCDLVPPLFSNLKWDEQECQRIGRDTPLCRAAYSSKLFFCDSLKNK